MDREGTAMALSQIAGQPGLKGAVFARDGDVKSPKPEALGTLEELMAWLARCSAHALKNLAKLIIAEMSGKACACSPKCGRAPGARCKPAIGHRVKSAVYYFLRKGVYMYLPELRLADMKRPCDVGSPAREKRRMEAIKWVEDKIIGMVLHYTGECTALCNHDTELGPSHLKFTCKAQVEYLATIMKAFVSILPEILTPFGLVHINGLEAKHAAYMPYRPKRVKLLGPECQLGECRGAMATVQLSLGYWDVAGAPRLIPEYELADNVREQHGLAVHFGPDERASLEKRLEARIEEKKRRDTPGWKAAKSARLQAKAKQLATREDGSYVPGGTAAALDADADPAGLGGDMEAGAAEAEDGGGDGDSDVEVEAEIEEAQEEEAPLDEERAGAVLEAGEGFVLRGVGAAELAARLASAE